MKKLTILCSFLALLGTHLAFAWKVKIANKTDGDIEVRFDYGRQSLCTSKDYIFTRGSAADVHTKGCCPNLLYIRPITGSGVKAPKTPRRWFSSPKDPHKLWLKHEPPFFSAGFATCKNFEVTVYNLATGELRAENRID